MTAAPPLVTKCWRCGTHLAGPVTAPSEPVTISTSTCAACREPQASPTEHDELLRVVRDSTCPRIQSMKLCRGVSRSQLVRLIHDACLCSAAQAIR